MADTRIFTVTLSNAIVCAMQLDDKGMRAELELFDVAIKKLKRGYKISTTLAVIERLAHHMTRGDGWDLNPSTIHACNQQAKKLRALVDEQRAKGAI